MSKRFDDTVDVRRFSRRFTALTVLAWTIPPVVGLSFLLFIRMFTWEQMAIILTRWLEPTFIMASLAFSVIYFNRFVQPILAFLREQRPELASLAMQRVARLPVHFWSVFLLYLLIAPSTVIISAEQYTNFTAQPADWFRIHLVALIVSIIVGLPIFFLIFDLIGRTLGGKIAFQQTHVTVKTKVFLIGALVPLLIDTILVQYYWTRTGYFTAETFAIWFMLEVLAIGGSIIFVRSFAQSLQPLNAVLTPASGSTDFSIASLIPQSTDELGQLTTKYRTILDALNRQRDILAMRNEILRSGDRSRAMSDTYDKIVEICREALRGDKAFMFLYDAPQSRLVCVAATDFPYNKDGHFSLALDRPSFARLVFEADDATAICDAADDPRASSEMVKRFNVKSSIGSALNIDGDRIGLIMSITQDTSREYDERDFDFISALANEASTIVKTQQLLEKQREAEAKIDALNQQANITLRSIGDGVISTDLNGNVEYLNPVAERLTGARHHEVVGKPLSQVLVLLDEATGHYIDNPLKRGIARTAKNGLGPELVLRNLHDGTTHAIELRVSPIRDSDGKLIGNVVVFHNISELRSMSRKLAYQANHDSLTGLINRRAFEKRLQELIDDARDENNEHALCYIDLDQFKVINDSLGHIAGDELLRQLTEHLKIRIRRADILARLGGDEFGLLLEGCPLERAQSIAQELLEGTRGFRFVWAGEAAHEIGLSIGLVSITRESGTLTDVLSAADSACYVAKDLGRNRLHVFQSGDLTIARHRRDMKWSQAVRAALANDRFLLYAQPIRSLEGNGEIVGSEVLVRMIGSKGDVVEPNSFITAAERYHLMPSVDRWVIRKTFATLASSGSDHRLSINLSGQSLSDEQFPSFIDAEFRNHGINPQRICFEITETAAMANPNRAVQLISELKKKGCQFALDDFGSGLSSFGYLKNLPVDYLKIDGSFIRDIAVNKLDLAMVEAIAKVGRLMNLRLVAEVVHDKQTYETLRGLDIDFGQGFYLAEPAPLDDVLSELAGTAMSSTSATEYPQ